MEADLVPMIEDEGAEASMEELLCPICLDLLHRPHRLNPCLHLFCDPCLRRLAGAEFDTCPICRSLIIDCQLDEELHNSIENQHQDVYIQRQQVEMISGIFNEPLPPDNGAEDDRAENDGAEDVGFVLISATFCFFLLLSVLLSDLSDLAETFNVWQFVLLIIFFLCVLIQGLIQGVPSIWEHVRTQFCNF